MSDYTLETLLDLDGNIFEIGSNFWVKIEARKVKKSTINKPHGIKYSLTLHSPNGNRILGYDNAHNVPGGKSDNPHDHVHKGERVVRYEYTNAEKLLQDFWNDVDKEMSRRL